MFPCCCSIIPYFMALLSLAGSCVSYRVINWLLAMGSEEWELYPSSYIGAQVIEYGPISEDIDDDQSGELAVSLDAVLPDDLLEKALSFLPVASVIRSGSVCKRWHEVVHARRQTWSKMVPQKPWYFMFTCSEEAVSGFAYDPSLRKWYGFDFPCIEKSNWSTSSSAGLVCLMDSENRSRIVVCNPITKDWKRLIDAPGGKSADYSALAISVSRNTHQYTVAVARSNQVPSEYYRWEFTIHLYESETGTWVSPFTEVLLGWRGGGECVICHGVLYYLVYSTGVLVNNNEHRHCLVMYDLSTRPDHTSLMSMAIPVPSPLTCGRLMNLRERLVLVGGIGKQDRPGIIKGIGVWELRNKDWHEVARMPHKFFQGFGEFDDVFASCGADDLIYIQSYGSPALLTFEINQKLWKWSVKSPVTKRFPLQLFTGFSFEPRLDIAS